MKKLYYNLYAVLSDRDEISLDELSKIKSNYNTAEKAKAAAIKNAEKIKKIIPYDGATIDAINIVEILLSDNDLDTEVVDTIMLTDL